MSAFAKARAAEAASKEALRLYCNKHKQRKAQKLMQEALAPEPQPQMSLF